MVGIMKSKGCDYGYYNKLTYRVCYGLTEEGKMDYATPHYEFSKYCKCDTCSRRLRYDREPSNSLTVTTDNKDDFPEIEKIIEGYTCESNYYIGYKSISMKNGKVKEKICR